MKNRFQAISDYLGHHWKSFNVQGDIALVELQSGEIESEKGKDGKARSVTMNDVILASLLNDVPMDDLLPAMEDQFWHQF